MTDEMVRACVRRVPQEAGSAPPTLDVDLLREAGVADKLSKWRKIAEAARAPDSQLVR